MKQKIYPSLQFDQESFYLGISKNEQEQRQVLQDAQRCKITFEAPTEY